MSLQPGSSFFAASRLNKFVAASVWLFLLCCLPLAAENIRSAYEKDFKDPFAAQVRVLPQPQTNSRSIVLLEQSSGEILYQREPDLEIPPASLTKLVVIALALEHISNNGIGLDTPVPISSRAWASNAPPRSSLMFLEPRQTPTWKDLLLGLAVVSGNDAAVAVAEAIDGSVEAFVSHMNRYASDLGLKATHFVEPSGYDEHNITTARDYAYFVWYYLQRFPQAISQYHSVLTFEYPYQDGLKPIKQGNRNDLLYDYPGADGLKTGYIDESGYNLAFTAQRNGMRLSGIILGGTSDRERFQDATAILDYGFDQFAVTDLPAAPPKTIRVWEGGESLQTITPAPHRVVLPKALIPGLTSETAYANEVLAPVDATTAVGAQTFSNADGKIILKFPIPAGIRINQANPVAVFGDRVYLQIRSWFGVNWPKNAYDSDR